MLKVLCLHGKFQSGDIFLRQTGAFRKSLNNIIDFHFVTSPHQTESPNETSHQGLGTSDPVYTWWVGRDPTTGPDGEVTFKSYEGQDESIAVIDEYIAAHGPFDGILGFSQGGILASMLANSKRFKFAIICGSLLPGPQTSLDLIHGADSPIEIPTLHFYGAKDTIIPYTRSIALANVWLACEIFGPEYIYMKRQERVNSFRFDHGGGHTVPRSAEAIAIVKEFIQPFLTLSKL